MGTNKRYAANYDRIAVQKVRDTAMASGKPESLTETELDLDNQPLTKSPVARPVTAWVHYGPVPIPVEGWTRAWTDRAIAVFWATPTGEHHAWVWASAVEPREPRPDLSDRLEDKLLGR